MFLKFQKKEIKNMKINLKRLKMKRTEKLKNYNQKLKIFKTRHFQ